jgi:hypothetical protein
MFKKASSLYWIFLFFLVTINVKGQVNIGRDSSSSSANNLKLTGFIPGEYTYMNVDILGNIYLISSGNRLIKLNNNRDSVAVFNEVKKYGNPSYIDVSNPLKILVYYKNKTIYFEKNSFLSSKKINENVDFIIKKMNGDIFEVLSDQNLFKYFMFYLSNIRLTDKTYIIEIVGTNSGIKLYNNLLEI